MDIVDHAQLLEQQHLQRSLEMLNSSNKNKVSRTHCKVCDEPIPEGRREAIQGVQTCIKHAV